MIEASLPDLVLWIFGMPGIDGMQTLGKIKEAHPQQQVVMSVGSRQHRHRRQGDQTGPHDYRETARLSKIAASINNALNYYRLEEEVSLLKEKERVKAEISGTALPSGRSKTDRNRGATNAGS